MLKKISATIFTVLSTVYMDIIPFRPHVPANYRFVEHDSMFSDASSISAELKAGFFSITVAFSKYVCTN